MTANEIAMLRINIVCWLAMNLICGTFSSERWLHFPAALGAFAFWCYHEFSRALSLWLARKLNRSNTQAR